jgi:LacI family transcriptional regulator
MPTIQDVARRAGVAPITVSRVINHSGYFSKETRQKVEAAIAELGYVPNTLARSLRSKKTHTLALILTDITNPFFTMISRGVEDAASDAGFMVIYCNTDESESEEEKYLQLLLQKQVDGILLVPARSTSRAIASIQEQGTAVVVLDRHLTGVEADIVRGDSQGGACLLVKHLIDLGHRQIAVLTGPESVSTAEDRLTGYKRALEAAGIPIDDQLIYYGAYTRQGGYEMAQRVLSNAHRPTALFAANNFIALGALRALREAGVRVPEEMALVCFDDLPSTWILDPFLTVAAQPAYEMGKKATELILARIKGQAPAPCQEIVLPVEIIVRRTSGGLRRPEPI